MKPVEQDDTQYGDVVYCFGKPKPGGRTGHGALLVLKKGVELPANIELTPAIIIDLLKSGQAYFFSMYPDVTPDVIPNLTVRQKLTTSYDHVTVNSLADDVRMRGRSEERFVQAYMLHKRKKALQALAKQGDAWAQTEAEKIHPEFENDTTGDLAANISEEIPAKLEEYAQLGMFDTFVKLPDHLDAAKVVTSLEATRENAHWTMLAPIPDMLPRCVRMKNRNDQNCCSAIQVALKAGGIDVRPSYKHKPFSTLIEIGLWASLFTHIMIKPDTVFSKELNPWKLLLLPLAVAATRLLSSMKNAQLFYRDICLMTKNPNRVGLQQQLFLGAAIPLLNAAMCLLTPNAWSTIIASPVTLLTELKKLDGVDVIAVNKSKPQEQSTSEQLDDPRPVVAYAR
ncbi:MAG: hypothetical protein P1U34_09350 [Coxiellaceae bacterium]|nr:hypothetical protein [Coxiellaceae bacterium]